MFAGLGGRFVTSGKFAGRSLRSTPATRRSSGPPPSGGCGPLIAARLIRGKKPVADRTQLRMKNRSAAYEGSARADASSGPSPAEAAARCALAGAN